MSWYLNIVRLVNDMKREKQTEEREDKHRMNKEGCANAMREDICL